jgi:hypothetical protein
LGTLVGVFVGVMSAHLLKRKRQAFEHEQTARTERAQAMQAARILDSALMEAEPRLTNSVVEQKRLWPDSLLALALALGLSGAKHGLAA